MRSRISLLVGGLIISFLGSVQPAQAALSGISISRSGTTVTVEIDCTLSFETPWPNVTLYRGDTLRLTSKIAAGTAGACNSFYADGSLRPNANPFALTDYFTPSFNLDEVVSFDAATGMTYVVKSDAPYVSNQQDIWAVLWNNGKGQHFNILIAAPPTATASRSELAKDPNPSVAVQFTTNAGGTKKTALFVGEELISDSVMTASNMANFNYRWCYFEGYGDITVNRTVTYRVYDTTGAITPTYTTAYLLQAQMTLIGDPNGCGPLLPNSTGVLDEGDQASNYSVGIFNPEAGDYSCYSVSVTDGALPDGLTLSEEGFIAGNPTAAGTFEFEVTCEWGEGDTTVRNYSILINPSGNVVVRPALIPVTLPVISMTTTDDSAVLTCAAPQFTPAAQSVTFAWLQGEKVVGSGAQLQVARGSSASDYTCRATGFAASGTHAVSTIASVPAVAVPTPALRKVTTFNIRFASSSSAISKAELGRITLLVAGLKNVNSVTVTGFVQATRVTSNDRQLSSSRANRVAATLKSMGIVGDYTVSAGGRSKLPGAQGRVVTVTINWTALN